MAPTQNLAAAARWITLSLGVLLIAACGGGGSERTCSDDPNRDPRLPTCTATPAPVATASSVQLLVSSQQLNSDGAATVALTVIALDGNRQGIANRPVQITVSDPANAAFVSNFNPSGSAAGGAHLTDANGQLTATLSTGGSKANRTITLTATVDGASASNTVSVVGTTLAISGPNALVVGATAQYGVVLTDSSGTPIANAPIVASSTAGNALSPANPVTNDQGTATLTLTGTKSGNDTISASSLGATAAYPITVSSQSFGFTTPTPGTQVQIGTPLALSVRWIDSGAPVVGQPVILATTRGTLTPQGPFVTDSRGFVTATLTSTSPGPATITAADPRGGAVASTSVLFTVPSCSPAKIDLQADRTSIPVNVPGSSASVAALTAVVRDAADNLLPGCTVNFHLDQDPTAGTLSPASAVTDLYGRAKAQYVPSAVSSPTNGVAISATVLVQGGAAGPSAQLKLTVGGQKLYVRIGTDNLLGTAGANYTMQYSAFVTDAAGNPVKDATVQFLLRPRQDQAVDPSRLGNALWVTQFQQRDTSPPVGVPVQTDYAYYKGTSCWTGKVWVRCGTSAAGFSPPTPVGTLGTPPTACFNEDVNFNGIIDPGEDYNGNGKLDPGNPFSVIASAATNSSGFASTTITYPKDRAYWVAVTLRATAQVAGTEAWDAATFVLAGLASDFTSETVAPPGFDSPYGTASNCWDPL